MEVNSKATAAQQNARFSRYRAVRKAIACEEQTPAVPQIDRTAAINAQQQAPCSTNITRAPSRYRRPGAPRQHHVPLPVKRPVALPTRSGVYEGPDGSQQIPEDTVSAQVSPPPYPDEHEHESLIHSQDNPASANEHYTPTQLNGSTTRKSTRYRSRTASAPKERHLAKQDAQLTARRSYDQAREEARLILEGEYDRIQSLKLQQEHAEKERRKRAEAKLAAQKRHQAEIDREPVREASSRANQVQEARPQRARQWTIGASSGDASQPPSTPQSPPTSQRLRSVREPRSRKVSHGEYESDLNEKHIRSPAHHTLVDAEKPTLRQRVRRATHSRPRENSSASPPQTPPTDAERPSIRQRVRRATHSRPKETSVTPGFQPRPGDGPPKTAVNGPAQIDDAPVSAVNAGERRVEIRCEKAKIWLPVTPSTTVKDLLNSASVIMSQVIDPRTSILLETYYPLRLERPLRRYERVRDVMNSWDSDTQNYLMIMSPAECAAVGLEQNDAPPEQPSSTMLNMYHSQKPGKWEKHWMVLRADGQVTASSKENDGNAPHAFHLSDFDVYMPTKKQMKQLKPPKKICFAIKSQQRSIMFESTENFVHFFATNDKAVADRWYNTVQAWRSWYLVNILEQGNSLQTVQDATAATSPKSQRAGSRPATSHARDSILYQLGTYQPLMNLTKDAIAYDGKPERQEQQQSPDPQKITSLRRHRSSIDHSRHQSIPNTNSLNLQRSTSKRHTTAQRPGTSSGPRHHHQGETPITIPSSTDAAFTGTGLLARAFSTRKPQAEETTPRSQFENTDNAFTGKGLLSHKPSTRTLASPPEDPNSGVIRDTNAAFTGTGLLSHKMSVARLNPVHEDPNPGVVKDTNDAFTGAGLLQIQRSLTKKRSANPARPPGQPLVDLKEGSDFTDASLLRRVEGWEAATGQNLPVIDRSKGQEVLLRTGEA